ncbi:MAG: sugar ABC transporter substrate-binding protein [Lachnospiraceae bacterium]|nr:sugar ABC transporter substrate-binding protein [Lachnospiraceae bacterium]
MRRRVCLSILLIAAFLFSACGPVTYSSHRTAASYKIGVVVKAINSPYWLDLQNGMTQAAEDFDVDLKFLYPSGERETEEQSKIIDNLLDSDVDALLVSPCDCTNTKWMLEKAQEKGILLLNVDDHAVDIDVPYIGSNHFKMGIDAAEYFSKLLPKGGNICMLLGPSNQMSTQERSMGIRNYLEKPLVVGEVVFTSMNQKSAYDAIMESEEKIDGVFCHNVVLAQGAILALEKRGWDAKVIAVDTEDDGKLVMKRGKVDAIIMQDGYAIGYEAIKAAVNGLTTGEPVDDIKFDSQLLKNE